MRQILATTPVFIEDTYMPEPQLIDIIMSYYENQNLSMQAIDQKCKTIFDKISHIMTDADFKEKFKTLKFPEKIRDIISDYYQFYGELPAAAKIKADNYIDVWIDSLNAS